MSGSSVVMYLDIFDKITRHKKFEVLKINFAHKYKDHSQMLYDEFCPEQKNIFSVISPRDRSRDGDNGTEESFGGL